MASESVGSINESFGQTTLQVLGREGMLPATAVLSILATSESYLNVVNNPLSCTFAALLVGGIGGRIIEKVTPTFIKPFIVGCLLLLSVGTITVRTLGWWSPKNTNSEQNPKE